MEVDRVSVVRRRSLRLRVLLANERGVFVLGCFMLISWVAGIAILWQEQHALWLPILTMGFTELFAGRAAAIAQAQHLGIPPGLTIFLATYVDAATVFIIYPLLVFGYENLFERRFFQKHMKPVFDSARRSLNRFAKYEIAGVFFFVWIPFWMTGVVVGAVLGYLLGLRTWVNMGTVVAGTFSAALCWAFAYDRLFDWLARIHKGVPVAFTVALIVLLLVRRILHQHRRNRRASQG